MSIATKVYSNSYDYKFGIFVEIMSHLAPEYICILQSDFKLIIVIVPAITDYNIMWPILVVKKVDNIIN